MNASTLFLITFIVSAVACFGQKQENLNVDVMLRGYIYAESSIEDTLAPGGFGSSANAPKRLTDSLTFTENGFFMKIDTSRIGVFAEKYNGYKLFMVNKSDTLVSLKASDSRLYIIAEVFYQGEWQPIEYLPSSWCGNSYHKVYLKQNEYWTFDVPKYTGKVNVKLRYKLIHLGNAVLYSNTINAQINKGQLTQKQGHKPNGIMDPYND